MNNSTTTKNHIASTPETNITNVSSLFSARSARAILAAIGGMRLKPVIYSLLLVLLSCLGGAVFAQTTTLGGGNIVAGNISPTVVNVNPAVSNPIASFSIVQSGSAVNLTKVIFTTTGTYTTSDITTFSLYVNTNANSLSGATAVTSGSVAATVAGTQTITLSTPYSLAVSTNPRYFFIVPTFGASPVTGNTIAVSAIPNANITVSAGSKSGSSLAGGTLTIFNTPVSILTSTGASRCGTGTLNLSATTQTGNVINWFAASSGGSSLGSGTSFTTPSISSTTNYFPEASNVSSYQFGTLSDITANLSTFSATRFDLHWFSSTNACTINSVQVYPGAAGNFTIGMYNSSGTLQASTTVTFTAGQVSNTVPVTVPLNFSVPAGATNYTLGFSAGTMYRGSTAGNYGPYTTSSLNGFKFTGDAASGSGFSGLGTRCYY